MTLPLGHPRFSGMLIFVDWFALVSLVSCLSLNCLAETSPTQIQGMVLIPESRRFVSLAAVLRDQTPQTWPSHCFGTTLLKLKRWMSGLLLETPRGNTQHRGEGRGLVSICGRCLPREALFRSILILPARRLPATSPSGSFLSLTFRAV